MASEQPILVVAGEASGDAHGAALLRELKALRPDITTFGIGGNELAAEGTELLVHASETNVTGFSEVLRKYRFLKGVLDSVIAEASRRRPSFAILVDYPGFNLRLARSLHELGIPVFYYIAPQVWAWKEGRVETIRSYVDDLAVLFPFEVDYFRGHGIDAHFFGHPLVNRYRSEAEERKTAVKRLIGTDPRPIAAYLPGSRPNEIRRHLSVIVDTVERLGTDVRHIIARAETIDRDHLLALLPNVAGIEVCDNASVVLEAADAAVVKSGTSTVQAALLGTPFTVIYKASAFSYLLGKTLAKVDTLAMVNLLAGRTVVREFLQGECRAERLADELRDLLDNGTRRSEMLRDFEELQEMLGRPDAYRKTAEHVAQRFLS